MCSVSVKGFTSFTVIYVVVFSHVFLCSSAQAQDLDSSLIDLMFPNNSFEKAWEIYPLHVVNSRDGDDHSSNDPVHNLVGECSFPDRNECLDNVDRESTLRRIVSNQFNSFANIINVNDIDSIFQTSGEDLVHGHNGDYSLVKKVTRDGEDWNGIVPLENLPIQKIHEWFNRGGFTLVINHMEQRWESIKAIAAQLLSETRCRSVSCNLYMTPADGKFGFEQHFDWMDVIVLQISGEKLWTVANKPVVYLTTPDMKHKPSLSYLEEYMMPGNYSSILLQPGDILYIPRGFVHNASTAITSVEPSLHLTFGIEHGCDTIVESLLHHALYLFEKDFENKAIDTKLITTLIHLSISEVSRNSCIKDKSLSGGVVRDIDACTLRKSISRGKRKVNANDSDDEANYHIGIDAFARLAEPSRAFKLFQLIMEGQTSPSGREIGRFCFPKSFLENQIDLSLFDKVENVISDGDFYSTVSEFYNFSKSKYHEILDLLII